MAREEFGFVIDKAEWDQVIAMAKQLPAKVGQQAMNKVVNDGIEAIMQSMRLIIGAEAENPTGNLSRMLHKKRKRKYEPSFWHGAVAVNVGKTRKDGAFYWNMVEHGHRVVTPQKKDTGKRVQAMRYAINAFELNKGRVVGDFARNVRAVIEKEFKKKAA